MKVKHGHTCPKTLTYHTWQSLKDRCNNKNNINYKRYGGKGIKVCDRWKKSFVDFLEDMGERPVGMSIERIDNNKGYTPNNCKWATIKEQNRNYSRNHLITLNGETKCLIEWVEERGLKYNTILYRILRGWSPKRALETKIK